MRSQATLVTVGKPRQTRACPATSATLSRHLRPAFVDAALQATPLTEAEPTFLPVPRSSLLFDCIAVAACCCRHDQSCDRPATNPPNRRNHQWLCRTTINATVTFRTNPEIREALRPHFAGLLTQTKADQSDVIKTAILEYAKTFPRPTTTPATAAD